MRPQLNPGSIHVRIGATYAKIEDARARGDVITEANLTGLLAEYCSVHMTEKEWLAYQKLPGLGFEDERSASQVSDDLSAKRRFLLSCVKEYGVFARTAPEAGDASALDEAEVEA